MYVIINGVSSDTIQGLQVLSLPPITKPKMRRTVDTIDGRAGDIVTELGYEAYDRTISILLHDTYDIDEVTRFFNTSGDMIFSNEPDKRYNFRLLEEIDYERAVKFRTADITFHVQPYKYPATETPTAGTTVINAGNVPAAPTIEIQGSGTVGVYVNGSQALSVDMSEISSITINAEEMDARSGGALANRKVTGDYTNLLLQPGENEITTTGTVSSISISNYTRWV